VPPEGKVHHLTLCELLSAGLSYAEAKSITLEDALCLLECSRYRAALAALDSESARVASLISADTDAQQRELMLLEQKARMLTTRFLR
jgi:hypothetical protein